MSKSILEACQPVGGLVWTNVANPGPGTVADTLVPVLNYNGSDTNTYLINSYGGGGAHVSLYKIDTSNVMHGAQVSVPAYTVATPASQPQSSVVIDTGNASITQAVNYKNGLYAALTSGYDWGGGNVDSVVDWMKFDPNAQTLTTSGLLGYPGWWYFYPSESEALNGSSLFTYTLGSYDLYVSTAAFAMDVNNNVTSNGYLSQGAYSTPQSDTMTCPSKPCSRWGDFSSTYTDPTIVNSFWSASQTMATIGSQSPTAAQLLPPLQ